MLAGSPLYPTIPTRDLDRARGFYEGVLGLPVIRDKGFEVILRAADVEVDVYASEGAGTAEHTIAAFIVDDIDSIVRGLRARGVVFEEYDLPGVKTVNGIADLGPDRSAWFRDPDGNLLNVSQLDAISTPEAQGDA